MRVGRRNYRAVWMQGSDVVVVNQPLLPHRFGLLRLRNHRQTADAIRTMIVRGAGTIGATAAYGFAQAVLEAPDRDVVGFLNYLGNAYNLLLGTRPTAIDLKHAVQRVWMSVSAQFARSERWHAVAKRMRNAALVEAKKIADEYAGRGRLIAQHGLKLIRKGSRVLTHCNAGWLALVDWGSAPAPIYLAHRKGRRIFVWVDETRPRNQGANLTSWEFQQAGIPHRIIADNSGGLLMWRGEVDLCIVGADRIAANGDVANKIGTYQKAVLARENRIPFYVAAPSSTIDWSCGSGKSIPIEERDEAEVLFTHGRDAKGRIVKVRTSPQKSRATNPAFDITPARYVTGIITERGIFKPNELKRRLKPRA